MEEFKKEEDKMPLTIDKETIVRDKLFFNLPSAKVNSPADLRALRQE